jgi:hypothetical protein
VVGPIAVAVAEEARSSATAEAGAGVGCGASEEFAVLRERQLALANDHNAHQRTDSPALVSVSVALGAPILTSAPATRRW